VVNDPEGALSRRYGVSAVPVTFVIDAGGKVRFVTRGYTSGLGLRLRLWLAGLF
jgi:alkyl hydroperoxide reductase subunit AhpC